MSKNQPSANRLKLAPLIINANRPSIFKMTKDDEEFYFDSSDLADHVQEFEDMGQNGWVLTDRVETLPAYLPLRQQALKNAGLVRFGWGYKKG